MSDQEYIEYLRKRIEELQEKNTLLRIENDRLQRESSRIEYVPIHSPFPKYPDAIPTKYIEITC